MVDQAIINKSKERKSPVFKVLAALVGIVILIGGYYFLSGSEFGIFKTGSGSIIADEKGVLPKDLKPKYEESGYSVTTYKSELPEDFPDDFPLMEDSKVIASAYLVKTEINRIHIVNWETNKPKDEVLKFYKRELRGKYMVLSKNISSSEVDMSFHKYIDEMSSTTPTHDGFLNHVEEDGRKIITVQLKQVGRTY